MIRPLGATGGGPVPPQRYKNGHQTKVAHAQGDN